MIVSIHNYELASSVSENQFRDAVQDAQHRNLFDLPGLVDYRFLFGIKGRRRDKITAIWEYESRNAWEQLWGSLDDPVQPEEYPDAWVTWETEVLDPLVDGDPDSIDYTSYEVMELDGDR